ncbi:MAG: PaaI family thioesterase [Xanthobacteraceae bacterium]|nr:PaaI family thioesterase [Xanthobacteraceae bacterium]GIK80494.1 MAG: phenylacetic acid degradation protein [Alphaproteobacteria bacterium]
MPDVAMTAEELADYLAAEFPQAFFPGSGLTIEAVWHQGCRVRQEYQTRLIRPGGTISGPTMMALADFSLYVALLGAIGRVPLAVTTNLNINFLRKPARAALIAEARLMKLGKRLAVGEVAIHSEGEAEPVAHVTSTYSIPPRNGDIGR